jgi:hypothetical protein
MLPLRHRQSEGHILGLGLGLLPVPDIRRRFRRPYVEDTCCLDPPSLCLLKRTYQ